MLRLAGLIVLTTAWAFSGASPYALAVDTDGDGVDDTIDVCCNTPPGVAVDAQGRPIGDFDGDCDNDLADFAIYIAGFTGPLGGPVSCPECFIDAECNDGNPCTQDLCNPTTFTCEYASGPYNGLGCDDGDACTVSDVCAGGACTGIPIPGCVGCQTASECDDGDACTMEVCVGGVCQYSPAPNGTPCDDGNACTFSDACVSGACTGTPIPGCSPCQSNAECDDGDACTMDVCMGGVCQYSPAPNGTPCTDGNFCTVSDVCNSGVCSGAPVDCSGLDDQCNTGACNGQTGACEQVPLPAGTPCDDGNSGTVGDACDGAGACVGTIP